MLRSLSQYVDDNIARDNQEAVRAWNDFKTHICALTSSTQTLAFHALHLVRDHSIPLLQIVKNESFSTLMYAFEKVK